MKFNAILKTSTSATFELANNDVYKTSYEYDVYLNDEKILEGSSKNVFSLYNLKPDSVYNVKLVNRNGEESFDVIRTEAESICLNVKRFGAKGDCVTDDTQAIQAAVMSCPEGGRVLIPEGTYQVKQFS